MKSGRNYKKIALTLDYEDIKVLRRLNPEVNLSEIARNAIKAEIEQELGLKSAEEKEKNEQN